MGAGIQPPGTGHGRVRPMAEINVTPFVDVMLVLLIIFMVTAPLLITGVDVDAPDTEAKPMSNPGEMLAISIRADGAIFIQDTQVEYENLVPRLQAMAAAGYDQQIYIKGDKSVPYDDVAKVIGRLNAAGFSRIGLVTD